MMGELPMKDAKYILWVNFGTEGWQPYYFNDLKEMAAYIQDGRVGSSGFKITKYVPFAIDERGSR